MSRKQPKMRGPFEIEVQRGGKTFTGRYTVEGTGPMALVHVTSAYGSKSTQAGNSGAEVTANAVLGSLIAWKDFADKRSTPEDDKPQ